MTSPDWTFVDEASDVSGVDWSAVVSPETLAVSESRVRAFGPADVLTQLRRDIDTIYRHGQPVPVPLVSSSLAAKLDRAWERLADLYERERVARAAGRPRRGPAVLNLDAKSWRQQVRRQRLRRKRERRESR